MSENISDGEREQEVVSEERSPEQMMADMVAAQKARAEAAKMKGREGQAKVPESNIVPPETVRKMIEGAQHLTERQWDREKNKRAGQPDGYTDVSLAGRRPASPEDRRKRD